MCETGSYEPVKMVPWHLRAHHVGTGGEETVGPRVIAGVGRTDTGEVRCRVPAVMLKHPLDGPALSVTWDQKARAQTWTMPLQTEAQMLLLVQQQQAPGAARTWNPTGATETQQLA